ncbi:MAG: TerC family protein [Legionellales bacterium]|nr:TerC family protein [Legionellales bacterium]
MWAWLEWQSIFALLTLIFLEVVLGIDNLVILAITCSRLPKERQAFARRFGLALALILRLLLLAAASWITRLTTPWAMIGSYPINGRNLLFLSGGTFLLYKGIKELFETLKESEHTLTRTAPSFFWLAILQIAFFDLVFSLDSVITAVGMTDHYIIMAIAITVAILVMLFASGPLTYIINRKPRLRILALCFIVLIGGMLLIDGLGYEISHSYVYVVIIFSLFVELWNSLYEKYE